MATIKDQKLIDQMTSDLINSMESVPIEEQIAYISRHVNNLTPEDKFKFGAIIVNMGHEKILMRCNEGTMILVRNLPDAMIPHLYNFCLFKMQADDYGYKSHNS